MILDAQALIGAAAPQEKRAHHVQRILWQNRLLIENDVGVGQINGEDRIVIADVGAEQQRLLAVEQNLQLRQVTRVVKKQAVGAARRRADIGIAVDDRKTVAVFQRAAGPRRCSGPRYIERGFLEIFGRGATCGPTGRDG